ncbi:hypothetical protein [Streptomyces antimycoticus]|uniref:hypothetical protein n=1 Tax=Streptomyces antimycoticus TaxID=68175 RepID=UPI000A3C3690|nr:hypothetical protein [Streptomyces antimycoticus]
MDLQTGVRIYQFVRDRLDDRRDEQHPHGHDAYVKAWRKAHDLDKDYSTAVHRGDGAEAERILRELEEMADEWKDHPDHPYSEPAA